MSTQTIHLLGKAFQLGPDLLAKYSVSGPRYTSYPTAPMWQDTFTHTQFDGFLAHERKQNHAEVPFSLYLHLPFCEHRCLFCGCNVIITQQREHAEKYLGYLLKEIDMMASRVDTQRPVLQMHWGGGTPTYLSPVQIERLMRHVSLRFNLQDAAEIAIEVDPRVTTHEQIELLRALGFNRISLGVQDFNPQVQQAVERIQPFTQTQQMILHCKELGYNGINIDLIYGLPHQTVASFEQTLQQILALDPDRIALYHYAHVPWISPHQTRIAEDSLPSSAVKFDIFILALSMLTQAGYVYIGMDHFAKQTDELTKGLSLPPSVVGSIHRNFMGYTTKAGASDLIGLGVSAISGFQNAYAQNVKKLSTYYEAIEANCLPIHRGLVLTPEDKLRRRIINNILCFGRVDYASLNDEFAIQNVPQRFSESLEQLQGMVEDQFLTLTQEYLELTPLGRIFSRNIAMAFDAYLAPRGDNPANAIYSKTL